MRNQESYIVHSGLHKHYESLQPRLQLDLYADPYLEENLKALVGKICIKRFAVNAALFPPARRIRFVDGTKDEIRNTVLAGGSAWSRDPATVFKYGV